MAVKSYIWPAVMLFNKSHHLFGILLGVFFAPHDDGWVFCPYLVGQCLVGAKDVAPRTIHFRRRSLLAWSSPRLLAVFQYYALFLFRCHSLFLILFAYVDVLRISLEHIASHYTFVQSNLVGIL